MKQAIIAFDLDDTLYKEADYVQSAFHAIDHYIKSQFGISSTFTILDRARIEGKNPFDALFMAIGSNIISLEKLLEIYRFHHPTITLDDCTHNLLDTLSKNHTLALITDGRSLTQRNKILALSLDKYFPNENIFISEETGHDKHSIHNFQMLSNQYPEIYKFYYIADNPAKDFFYPNQLGWTTVCLKSNGRNIHPQDISLPNPYQAAHTISNIAELASIIAT